jgi:hypothetical protein
MNDAVPPLEQCDVLDKVSLKSYRAKAAQWWRWLKTDKHHALWPQIYSMLLEDLTFRTLTAAAEADKESALHSPILARGLIQGHAATQGLSIRRLVDTSRKVISLRRLLMDIRNNLHLLTRENYVSGGGLPFDPDGAMQEYLAGGSGSGFWMPNTGNMAFFPSMQAHGAFDQLSGMSAGPRNRTDKIPKRAIDTLETWFRAKEIDEVVDWSNMRVAHAADEAAYQGVDFAALTPTIGKISTAQRQIVRTAEVISAYILRGPIHGSLIPVFQYSQFNRFEVAVRDPKAVKVAQKRWHELAEERDRWTNDVLRELTAEAFPCR